MTLEAFIGLAAVSTVLMAFVQWIKKFAVARNWEPLLILAGLSIIGGIVYALLVGFDLWEVVVAQVYIVATAANAIYSVLAAISKALTGENRFAQNA